MGLMLLGGNPLIIYLQVFIRSIKLEYFANTIYFADTFLFQIWKGATKWHESQLGGHTKETRMDWLHSKPKAQTKNTKGNKHIYTYTEYQKFTTPEISPSLSTEWVVGSSKID